MAISKLNKVLSINKSREIKNLEVLTCMADYRIPQVFYNLQVLDLSDNLKQKLENCYPLASGSKEELALRSTVIVIGKELSGLMKISEWEVDDLLWKLSQKMAKEGQLVIPHMIVATDEY